MKRVYLIRHAETGPRPGKPSDGDAVGLTAGGRLSARKSAKRFAMRGGGAVISSPLVRARETASFFAEALGTTVVIDERAREFVAADVGPPDFKILRDKARQECEWVGEGGESFNASIARLTSLLESAPDRACIVTHELLIQNLLLAVEKVQPAHIDHLTIFALEPR